MKETYQIWFSMIDYELSEEQMGQFYRYANNVQLINTRNGKRFYSGLLIDINLLEDQYDEEGNLIRQSLLNEFSALSPEILGVWNTEGTQYGIELDYVFDEEGNLINTIKSGTPIYPLQTTKILDLMPDEITTNSGGNNISTSRPTQLKQLNKFSGYGDKDFE